MNVEKCRKLLKEKKFDELLELLESEMCTLYKEMLDYAKVEYCDDWTFTHFGSEIRKKYSKYKNIVVMCENALYSGEYEYGQAVDIILDSYYEMSKNYKEKLDV